MAGDRKIMPIEQHVRPCRHPENCRSARFQSTVNNCRLEKIFVHQIVPSFQDVRVYERDGAFRVSPRRLNPASSPIPTSMTFAVRPPRGGGRPANRDQVHGKRFRREDFEPRATLRPTHGHGEIFREDFVDARGAEGLHRPIDGLIGSRRARDAATNNIGQLAQTAFQRRWTESFLDDIWRDMRRKAY